MYGVGRDKCVSFVLKRIEAVQPFSKSSCYLIAFAFKHDIFEYFLRRALGCFFFWSKSAAQLQAIEASEPYEKACLHDAVFLE